MNIWKHSQMSVAKFGGLPNDYFAIHKFIDSSKLFYYHIKHRILLHHTFGIELSIKKFGDLIVNSSNSEILVRDIVSEHLKEDLNGKVPTINDWLHSSSFQNTEKIEVEIPDFSCPIISEFINSPYLRTRKPISYIITYSDFGVYLFGELFGVEESKKIREVIPQNRYVKELLTSYQFSEPWQFTPKMSDLELIKMNYEDRIKKKAN